MEDKLKLSTVGIWLILTILLAGLVYAGIITWSDGTRTIFTLTDNRPVCEGGRYWVEWINSGGSLIENRTPTANDCYRENGIGDDGVQLRKCCVFGENSCDITNFPLQPATCIGPAINDCGYYDTKDICNNDDFNVSVATVEKKEGGGFCRSHHSEVIAGVTCDWYVYGCRCLWDDTTGRCNANYTKSKWSCYNETGNIVPAGNCVISTEKVDECNSTGYITYNWNAEWIGDPEPLPEVCTSDSKKLKCSARLSFFTIASFTAAILLIILVYIWIKRKNKITKLKTERRKKKV